MRTRQLAKVYLCGTFRIVYDTNFPNAMYALYQSYTENNGKCRCKLIGRYEHFSKALQLIAETAKSVGL